MTGDAPGSTTGYSVVIPTIGRPSLHRLLSTVATQRHRPHRTIVVDDRPPAATALPVGDPAVTLVRSAARGPAAARNRGWPLAGTEWVVFLDDDVELPPDWSELLLADLARCGAEVGGCQGRIRVPLPTDRRPTAAERLTAGLEGARWATADMAYRREVLTTLHGFDERFPRAFREDADLALRTRRAGWHLTLGTRTTLHPPRPEPTSPRQAPDPTPGPATAAPPPPGTGAPTGTPTPAPRADRPSRTARGLRPRAARPFQVVRDLRPRAARPFQEVRGLRLRAGRTLRAVRGLRPGAGRLSRAVRGLRPRAGDWALLKAEAGNADDALMRHLHGREWRSEAEAPAGRFGAHVATVAAAGGALLGLVTGRRRVAAVAGIAWAGLAGQLLAQRLRAGPSDVDEVRRTVLTTGPIPFAAVGYRLLGAWRHRHAPAWPPPLRAVLFDRDGTLVHDVPYNGDPAKVRPVAGAAEAVARLRAAGIRVGVVSNQSGIGRGLLTTAEVDAVNARIDALVGPFDTWQVCPHAPDAGCDCRKPAPGLVRRAARALRVPVECCTVIGDIGSDVSAARAAGARAVLVPTPVTRPEEIAAAPLVAGDLREATALLLTNNPLPTTTHQHDTPPKPAAVHDLAAAAPAPGNATRKAVTADRIPVDEPRPGNAARDAVTADRIPVDEARPGNAARDAVAGGGVAVGERDAGVRRSKTGGGVVGARGDGAGWVR